MNNMGWTEETKKEVWNHSSSFKDDYKGRIMKFSDYGNRESEYGWEIDHIKRIREGGTDTISNLRPVHWKTNLERES